MSTSIGVHHVVRICISRHRVRGQAPCHDHDRWRIICSCRDSGDEEIVIYAEPGALDGVLTPTPELVDE